MAIDIKALLTCVTEEIYSSFCLSPIGRPEANTYRSHSSCGCKCESRSK